MLAATLAGMTETVPRNRGGSSGCPFVTGGAFVAGVAIPADARGDDAFDERVLAAGVHAAASRIRSTYPTRRALTVSRDAIEALRGSIRAPGWPRIHPSARRCTSGQGRP